MSQLLVPQSVKLVMGEGVRGDPRAWSYGSTDAAHDGGAAVPALALWTGPIG